MKKDLLLILSIFEGRDWKPENGLNVVIEAKLDSHSSFTDPIPLTSSPKFNSEITWQVEKQIIRSYKIGRVPIKVECFSVNEEKRKSLLGYVILSLNTAVEGVEVDPKWYKLLGTPSESRKNSPSILLGLTLESMTLDKKNTVNEGQIPMNSQTQSYVNNQFLFNGGGFPGSISITKSSSPAITNGDKMENHVNNHPHPVQNPVEPVFLNHGSQVIKPPFSAPQVDEEEIAVLSDDEEEDYMSGEEDEIDDLYDQPRKHINGGPFSLEFLSAEGPRDSIPPPSQQDATQKPASKPAENLNASLEESKREAASSMQNDPHAELIKAREANREFLRRHSKELFDVNLLNSSALNKSFEVRDDESAEKRILDISSSSESLVHKSKSRKLDSSFADPSNDVPSAKSADLERSLGHPSLCSPTTSRDVLGLNTPTALPNVSKVPLEHREKLVARLDEDGGFFHFGSSILGIEEDYEYSISIYGAKNLSQVVPESIATYSDGFQFCYSILGCSIYTEPFFELDEPHFIVEKASTSLRATKENVIVYFSQHSFLPVYLISGDITLATCNIDLTKLCEIEGQNVVIDKSHKLCAMTPLGDHQPVNDSEALVSISVELEKCLCPSEPTSRKAQLPDKDSFMSQLKGADSRVVRSDDSSTDSSFSDLDEHSNSFAKLLKRRPSRSGHRKRHDRRTGAKCLKNQMKEELQRHKERLLQEAVQEIEEWKEEQRQTINRELTMKEELLQKRIASDLSTKVKVADEELKGKLRECDILHQRMVSTMNELKIREESIMEREKKLSQEEMDLHKERLRFNSLESRHPPDPTFDAKLRESIVSHRMEFDNTRKEYFENKITKLQDDLKRNDERFTEQTREILALQKRLLQSEDASSLRIANEKLKEQLSVALERKQFYKSNWMKGLDDLHKLHSAHKQTIEKVVCNLREHSPEPSFQHPKRQSPSAWLSRTRVTQGISKLKEERETLLSSGIYAPDHSLIKTIDKELKSLAGSAGD